MKHDLESLLDQISVFSCLILARIITFSPSRTRSKPPSLEALYSFPPFHSLHKFHVSCFVLFSHFISLPPASLSLLLHFNCDFHGYRTRSRSTCIKCPAGINLLLVLTEPRLFGQGYFFITSVWRILQPMANQYFRLQSLVFKQLVSLSAPKTLP